MVVMAPKDENELRHMLRTAVEYPGPAAVRYPRGDGFGVPLDPDMKTIPIGEAELLRDGDDVAVLALGTLAHVALEAAAALARGRHLGGGRERALREAARRRAHRRARAEGARGGDGGGAAAQAASAAPCSKRSAQAGVDDAGALPRDPRSHRSSTATPTSEPRGGRPRRGRHRGRAAGAGGPLALDMTTRFGSRRSARKDSPCAGAP